MKAASLVSEVLEQAAPLVLLPVVPGFSDHCWAHGECAVGDAVGDNGIDLKIGFEGRAHQLALRIATVIIHAVGRNQQRSPRLTGFPHATECEVDGVNESCGPSGPRGINFCFE